MMPADISIVIPVYNGGLLLQRCLDSIIEQVDAPSVEVILVDDGSTDDSVSIAKSYGDPRISIISQQNGGPAKARNKGLANAKGRYLAFLDADDFWENSFLSKTYHFLEGQPEVIAVSVGQRHLSLGHTDIIPKCLSNYDAPIVLSDFFSFWAENHHVCTGSALIRTDVVKSIGGQREDLRVNEDWEFWLMVATYGKWAFIPEVLFTSDGTKVTERIGWLEKMRPRWKNAPSVEVWEKRIIERLKDQDQEGYRNARGYVAADIILSQVLSLRYELSRKEFLKYGADFPAGNPFGKIYRICAWSGTLWKLMAKGLLWREKHRK